MAISILSLDNVVIMSDPELAKQASTASADVLRRGEGVGPWRRFMGPGRCLCRRSQSICGGANS